NRPGLTAAKFIKIAGSSWLVGGREKANEAEQNRQTRQDGTLLPNSCFYRTGDLVRWLPTGELEFIGRIDHQVKLRGFRIEPEEIRNCLLTHPEVKEAVVDVRQSKEGEGFLCVYYVAVKEGTGESPALLASTQPLLPSTLRPICSRSTEFKDFLSEFLPDYMLPSVFIRLEKIPLTRNGKINRTALAQ
ncbi:MAG: amino acid adenylation domain-containing protein, partial [bacterium]|nr:amino acid adenylation domain-containing protein [bacterium]